MKINLNDRWRVTLRVTLTEKGARIYTSETGDTKQAGDIIKDSLWALFNTFGSEMHIGADPTFFKNELSLEDSAPAERLSEKFYAVFLSHGHANIEFKTLYPTFEAAKERVDFEVESSERMKRIIPQTAPHDYLVFEIPVVYVAHVEGKP